MGAEFSCKVPAYAMSIDQSCYSSTPNDLPEAFLLGSAEQMFKCKVHEAL